MYIYRSAFLAYYPFDVLLPLQRGSSCLVRGLQFACPAKPELALEILFGPTWRVPSSVGTVDVNKGLAKKYGKNWYKDRVKELGKV